MTNKWPMKNVKESDLGVAERIFVAYIEVMGDPREREWGGLQFKRNSELYLRGPA